MPSVTCKECGKLEELHFNQATMDKLQSRELCFGCNHWTELLDLKDDPRVVRCDGLHFMMGESTAQPHRWSGFGGIRFEFTFFDGRKAECNNVWSQGKIPDHFKDRLPPNATRREIGRAATQY